MSTHTHCQQSTNPPVILLVDDIKSNILLFEKMLEGSGITVLWAVTTDDAINIMNTSHISLACIDINMPGRSGFDLIADMKSSVLTASIPFVMITSDYDYRNTIRAFECGALDYIVKPIDNIIVKHKLTALIELIVGLNESRYIVKEIQDFISSIDKKDLSEQANSSLSIIQLYIDKML